MDWKEISRQLVEGLKTNGMALVPIVPPTMEGPLPSSRSTPYAQDGSWSDGQPQVGEVLPSGTRGRKIEGLKGPRRSGLSQRAGDVVHVGVARIVPEQWRCATSVCILRVEKSPPSRGERPMLLPILAGLATAASIPSAIESTGNILGDVGVDLTGKLAGAVGSSTSRPAAWSSTTC